jgi:Rrf2 family protein
VHISAKADYAMRALLALASSDGVAPVKAESLAREQGLPVKFLENILVDLRRAGIVASQRGAEGGYRLARPAAQINAAEVIRALDGPLAEVRGLRPEATVYQGAAVNLQQVWVAARASLRSVLESVTLEQVLEGKLPKSVQRLADDPDAWLPH